MGNNVASTESFDPTKIRSGTIWKIIGTGLGSLFISALVFIGSIRLFPLTSNLPESIGTGEGSIPIDWSMLEGITSLVTMSIFIGGVIFAFTEYLQTAIQRKREDAETSFNIYKELYDRLMRPEAIAARRWIILNLKTIEETGGDEKKWLKTIASKLDESPAGWKGERPPGREHLKEILNTFDFVGFVAKHYWNMENELVVWMSPSIAKVWERIDAYVEEEAIQRNEPDYYESAREFGKHCVEWRCRNYPKPNIIKKAT